MKNESCHDDIQDRVDLVRADSMGKCGGFATAITAYIQLVVSNLGFQDTLRRRYIVKLKRNSFRMHKDYNESVLFTAYNIKLHSISFL